MKLLEARPIAALGVAGYLLAVALPLTWDLPLVGLAMAAVLAVFYNQSVEVPRRPPILWTIAAFLSSAALSTALSIDPGRSFELSVSLLPACLLYFLLSEYVATLRQLRMVILGLCAAAMVIASMVLWAALLDFGAKPTTWILQVGSPVLVVPNDAILLSLVAPFALVLALGDRTIAIRLVAALTLLFAVLAVLVLNSRSALLTLLLCLGLAGTLLRPRLGFWAVVAVLPLLLAIEIAQGFPLASKFARLSDERLALWLSAWTLFTEAPILGHGPHSFGLLYRDTVSALDLPGWMPIEGRSTPWPHNLYLEMLAEQGLIGLTTLLTMLGAALLFAWRLVRNGTGDARHYAVAVLASLCGFCAAAFLELSFLRLWVLLVVFMALGLIASLYQLKVAKE